VKTPGGKLGLCRVGGRWSKLYPVIDMWYTKCDVRYAICVSIKANEPVNKWKGKDRPVHQWTS
jgi:hypothetical protein